MGFMSNHVKINMKNSEYPLAVVVFKLNQIIKRDGYKSKAKFGDECTSIICEQELGSADQDEFVRDRPRVDEIIVKINKRFQESSIEDDFMNSCKNAVGFLKDNKWSLLRDIKNYKIGFLAALVNTIIKEEKDPSKEDLSHLGWIGREMQRGNFFVKLTEMIIKEDYTVHKVVDKTGNRGIFFNYKMKNHKGGEHADDDTVNYTDGIDKGDCFLMTATPSRHQINKYDGGKETYFNRVTIVENKGNKIKQRLRENVARENMPKYIDESVKVG